MSWGRRAALLAAAACAVPPAGAERTGLHAISLVTGAAPGSAAAHWAQSFAPFLERHWPGHGVGVRSVPGRRGLDAADAVAAGDAATIGLVATPFLVLRALEAGRPDAIERLAFVAAVVEDPIVLVAAPLDAVEPGFLLGRGAVVTVATPPPATAPHLAARLLSHRGAALDALPFATAAAARKAVANGSVPAGLLALHDAVGALREEKLVPVAVAGEQRLTLLPETPTLTELGMRLALSGQRGLVVPAASGAPAGLQAALRAMIADPDFIADTQALGLVPRLVEGARWRAEAMAASAGHR